MPRIYKEKLGDRGGVKDWHALATTGDVKRFLRWCILSARNQSMSTRDAAVFSQLALAMLKALTDDDYQRRLEHLENVLKAGIPCTPPLEPGSDDWKRTGQQP